ncbi:putative bifunctional diguanylate cyclase/phosphodiesterase [Reinekea marinisedimentorum]|uniref:cyclic-guanylate-specific phosphodiesterase n=1 Tax=Reinekea marinisedimentorum TaxID=230495 RepID=A0A4V2UIQ8_9GAMM|nr:EAL domain-containing protein [Reinekea marinisedimentorum]TCS37120.1 diguanylate cyclase (GGDEF)-like protein [Reinekea marinisedimentorum]
MPGLHNLSVAAKIRWMIVSVAAFALLLTTAISVSVEVNNTRNALLDRVQILSNVISTHVTAALSFGDAQTATRLLQSMDFDADIIHAQIYEIAEDAQAFASYDNPDFKAAHEIDSSHHDYSVLEPGHDFTLGRLNLASPIELDGETIGMLCIEVSLASLWLQILRYLLSSLAILLVVLFFVYLLARRLQRRIAGPFENLVQGMKNISASNDFSHRIEKGENDEVGQIIDNFNEMIGQIERSNLQIQAKNKEVEQHAFYDALTGLPNRRMLMQQLSKELNRCSRTFKTGALLYLDLDHFKTINDSLGHTTGDMLLKEVAHRLRSHLRKGDTPARVGGDEFVVILTDLDENVGVAAENALSVAEALRKQLSSPYVIEERRLHSSPSIGIALFHHANDSADDLIKQADLAMYKAKEDGRNLVQFFAADMQKLALRRMHIEEDLRHALESDPNQLELHYQPQVNHNGEIFGAEALIRWNHPTNGRISPEEFIPVAEVTGLIHPLGKWVLSHGLQQLSVWQSKGLNTQLAINISPNQFLQEGFLETVTEAVKTCGVNAERFELEITESVIMRDIDEVVELMKELKTLGIKFSIDDFGTGYSSLQYLTKLPISKLKIDKSFINDLFTDPNDAAIVNTIIAMTKHLGVAVIAEGVETLEEANFLFENGCDAFQGYYYDRPMPATDMEGRLLQQKAGFTAIEADTGEAASAGGH